MDMMGVIEVSKNRNLIQEFTFNSAQRVRTDLSGGTVVLFLGS